MPYNREHALDVLGLPTFATESDILLRYKALSLMWFPENHTNPEAAEQEFILISEAALHLLLPERNFPQDIKLPAMYCFFNYIFFGNKEPENRNGCCDSDDSDDDHSRISSAVGDTVAQDNAAEQLLEEEEREKSKIEKRRTKKKKRKERKKLEKLENEKAKEKATEKVKSKDTSTETTTLNKKQDIKSSSESEEEIDTNSAFVSVVAKKHRKNADIEIKDAPRQTFSKLPKEDPSSIVFRSRQIALRGNQMASTEHYSEAVELFSESIKLDPSDHRFYGNRSYCYDRLGQFERALKDAEKSITLCPVWPKGYFRKGRALLGLKKYAPAEQCFIEVLKLDNDCEDAVSELRNVKILQIMEKGYSKAHAEQAISKHSSVADALSNLVAQRISRLQVSGSTSISATNSGTMGNSVKNPKLPDHLYDIKRDPNNPEGHCNLWIGNVQPDVTEKKLLSMFSPFGELVGVKAMPEKFCAFINYKTSKSPGKAMEAYQGKELNGYKLVIRFPNLPGEAVPAKKKTTPGEGQTKGPVNGNECYYWRTTGCIYGEQCRYKHKKEHKGIDKQKWMA